ncbi:hypothetical protein [Maribacter halichondriae]|uniref:hypothetical protein n=1 Tax=Maribacter halichondriae TaxID=2980554 RepID=UPI0023598B78|nr:hypothetical protein [Maribacter sp. Hal144]
MEEWFSALTLFEKIYWGVALIASVILTILVILTLLGGDAEDMDGGDVDADIEGDHGIGFQFLSFKNLMGFLTIFGWSGIACLDGGLSKGLTVMISVVCGLLMMLAMASFFTIWENCRVVVP